MQVVQSTGGIQNQEDPVSIKNFIGVLKEPIHSVVKYYASPEFSTINELIGVPF